MRAAEQFAPEEPLTLRTALVSVAVMSSFALAACGGESDGDAKAADNAVSEGYLQHFEKVEGPLGKVDHELNEKLEDSIREELREKIQDGGSISEVTRMVSAIKADLATAE